MKRCAVVIGVNKTGDLPVLQAAASGAEQFADWAKTQGIDTVLLKDGNGAGVSLSDVKKAIRSCVKLKTYSQLIVFFSGHGILRAPDYELWLLSGAPDDPNDAINVPGSIWLARNSGIQHVVVISDACRSRPNSLRLSQIQGGVIFPNESPRSPRPAVDVFYATMPGDPAMEVPASDELRNCRGIFTECLLKGLRGEVPDIIVDMGDKHLGQIQWVVPSWELKPYLEEEVPDAASKINIRLQQDPDIRVESHPPKFLAEVAAPSSPSTPRSESLSDKTPMGVHHQGGSYKRYFSLVYGGSGDLPYATQKASEKAAFKSSVKQLMEAKGRESFETRTGFTVVGAEIISAVVTSSSRCETFNENGAAQIRVCDEQGEKKPQSLIVQFPDGRGIPLAVMHGFIGTIVVEDGRVVNVSYLPSRHTNNYSAYEHSAREIDMRRAFVAVAARNGAFRIDKDLEAAEAALFLREFKWIDPTLGLYAAYAYAQAGDLSGVDSVHKYMKQEPVPILFDVALLANKLPKPRLFSKMKERISPFCPMLTQGWALLKPYEGRLPTLVHKVRRDLVPGLWTTFNPEGTDRILSAIENGELS